MRTDHEQLGYTPSNEYHPTLAPDNALLDMALGSSSANDIFLRDCLHAYGDLPLSDGTQRLAMFCGPANTTYAHILSAATGIPLRYASADQDPGPRLELRVGYYYPPGDQELISDHTHIRYHDGHGNIGYIDCTYPLLWGGASIGSSIVQQLIHFRSYPAQVFTEAVAAEFNLFDFTADTPTEVLEHPFVDDPKRLMICEQQLNDPDPAGWPEPWRDAAMRTLARSSERFMNLATLTADHGERYSLVSDSRNLPAPIPTASRLMESIQRERYHRKTNG